MKVKDAFMLYFAKSGDTIDLPEGTFEFTAGSEFSKEYKGYLTLVQEGETNLLVHVRDDRGVALLPVGTLVEMLLCNEYTVS